MINNNLNKNSLNIDIIDGLRGIAILMVVCFHYWQISWISFGSIDFIAQSGFIGVELFFFISAFCIFYPYALHIFEGIREQSIKEFFLKRADKIIPSYILAIVLILTFQQGTFSSLREQLWNIFTHIIFIHNFFPETYYSINGVFWSLAVEIQFYILFPIILYLFKRKPFLTYISLCSISLVYRYCVLNYFKNDINFLLNQTINFLDIFASGIMTAYLLVMAKNRLTEIKKLRPFFTVMSIIAILIFLLLLKSLFDVRFDKDGTQICQLENRYLISIIFSILTLSLYFSSNIFKKLFSNIFLRFMSIISYNLYIWHQFIGRKIQISIEKNFVSDIHSDYSWQISFMLISIIASLFVSIIITFLFERPLLKKLKMRWKN